MASAEKQMKTQVLGVFNGGLDVGLAIIGTGIVKHGKENLKLAPTPIEYKINLCRCRLHGNRLIM